MTPAPMNHLERVSAVLNREPVDRLPVSVWGHDFLREWSAADLAAQTIERHQQFDYDFVKINPRWTLFAEPWGNQYAPPTEQKFPELVHRIINGPEDIARVPVVPADNPVFNEHTEAVSLVTDAIGQEVDCIATLFSPLAVLGLLGGGVGRSLTRYLPDAADDIHGALSHITETLTDHADNLLQAGASGVFYAPLQWTSLDACSAEIYAEFGEPYDRKLLKKIDSARFNMLHVCGNNIAMPRFYDYPVPVLNWDNFGEGNPGLEEVAKQSGKIVAGGIPHKKLHKLDETALRQEAEASLGEMDLGVMLAGGCGIGATVAAAPRQAVIEVAAQLPR